MTNLLGMLRKAVEAKGKEVSFPADEAEMAIIAAIRAVNASHEREVAENGYKNILDLHQETYKELQSAQAEARELRAELERLREIREAAVDVMGNAIRQESGDYIVFGRPLSRLIAALSQPADWPEERIDIIGQNGNCGLHYEQADLPLMARQEWMGDAIGAMREEPDHHVWQFYYEKDQSLMLQEASEGLEVYRIADTDEHGLPVIERTADMPEWAKYRINGERYEREPAVMPSTYFEQDWQRIEDYNEHGQENKA